MGVTDGRESYREASDEEILASARSLLARRVRRGVCFQSPRVVKEYLLHTYSPLDYEVFVMIALDNRHRLIEIVPLFRGTIDGAQVYPREVVKEVLRLQAAAVCFCHGHCSGSPEPSHADELITQRLVNALALVDVRVLDHFVIAGDSVVSFADRGLL
jgi:DNA repair protein RadC